MGITSSIKGWLKQPFQSNGSALNWVLFVGLLIVASILWSRVLRDLKPLGEAV